MYLEDSYTDLRTQFMHPPACLNHNRIKSSSWKTDKAEVCRLGYICKRQIWIKNGKFVVRFKWRSCWGFRYSGMWCGVTGWVIPCESNDHFTFWVKQSRLRLLDPWRRKLYNNFKRSKLLTQQHSDTRSLFYTFLHSCFFTLLGSKCFLQCIYFIQQKTTKFYTTKNSR